MSSAFDRQYILFRLDNWRKELLSFTDITKSNSKKISSGGIELNFANLLRWSRIKTEQQYCYQASEEKLIANSQTHKKIVPILEAEDFNSEPDLLL